MKHPEPTLKLSHPNLLAALDAVKMNQADLARATGWSEAKVSRLLKGKTKDVTVAMLEELMKQTGAKAAYLLDLEDVAQNDEERRLLLEFRAAEQRDRQLAQAALQPRKT